MTDPVGPRRRTWRVLNIADPDDPLTRCVSFTLLTLILLNVAAVVLGSVKSVAADWRPALVWVEVLSVVIFSVEYAARVWSCVEADAYRAPVTGRLRFVLSPLALVDLAAVLPALLALATFDLRFLRALRLARLARVAKLGRYSSALRLLGRVVAARKEELVVTVLVMALLIVLASSFLYFAEREAQPDKFPDIPAAMWWAVVTLTTVGYGDVYPVTTLGKLFAGVVAVFGVGMVALPTGILGASFVEELRRANGAVRFCPHCGKELD